MTEPQPNSPASEQSTQPTPPTETPASAGDVPSTSATSETPPVTETVAPATEPSSTDGQPPSAPSDLPEWEPLTPELVEDEAIRGDFMLRWAVILLALLLGSRQITETEALVHIRTGEHIASNGFWPPAHDVFSYTVTDNRPWINQSWLFDLVLAGLNGLGGATAVSLAVGLAVAITFYWLVHIGRPQIPTWWTAICACVALLAAQLYFVPLPRLITLLGVAWMLRGLIQWSETHRPATLWCLAGSLAVWANLDSHAYVGLLMLLAYAIGGILNGKLSPSIASAGVSPKPLWVATGIGAVALCLNPFGWNALLAPVVCIRTELPVLASYAMRSFEASDAQWFAPFNRLAWMGNVQSLVAFAVLLAVTLVTCVLNRRRLDWGLVLIWLSLTGLAAVSVHDMVPAVLAACVLSCLNGQDWYRHSCRQEYSTATWEVLYSRAGRAATALAFAGLAYLAISGRSMGRDGKRVGLGFSPQLDANIRGTQEDFAGLEDARMFPYRLDQGDLAIWGGHKVFVDSRVALYARPGEDILQFHEQARTALRRPAPNLSASRSDSSAPESESARREIWKPIFERFGVTHVTPRLWGMNPSYPTMFDLLESPHWELVRLGATAAIIREVEQPVAERTGKQPAEFGKRAFEECYRPVQFTQRPTWPRTLTSYQNFLSLPASPVSNATQRSRHELRLLQAAQERRVPVVISEALALAVLAIREANAGLVENVNDSTAYVCLADAYGFLGSFEAIVGSQMGLPALAQQRQFQSLAALQQALVVEPNNRGLMAALVRQYLTLQRFDLALDAIQRFMANARQSATLGDEDIKLVRQLNELKGQLEPARDQIEEQLAKAQEQKTDLLQMALFLHSRGYPLRALELLEGDKIYLSGNLPAQLEQALLLTECGRLEDAAELFDRFEQIGDAPVTNNSPWQLQAALLSTARGDYDRAIHWCRQRLNSVERAAAESLLSTMPLATPDPVLLPTHPLWPFSHLAASQATFNTREEAAVLRWTIGTFYLESGRCDDAVREWRDCLKHNPETPFRPLIREYLSVLRGDVISPEPPSEHVPVLFEDGTGDPEPPAEQASKVPQAK